MATETITAIHEELSNARTIEPHWLKVEQAVIYSGLSRSKLYQLIESKVRSVCLRDTDKLRGTRLIFRPSLDAYFLKHEGLKSEPIAGKKGRTKKAMT
jgi:hypothetical protein